MKLFTQLSTLIRKDKEKTPSTIKFGTEFRSNRNAESKVCAEQNPRVSAFPFIQVGMRVGSQFVCSVVSSVANYCRSIYSLDVDEIG